MACLILVTSPCRILEYGEDMINCSVDIIAFRSCSSVCLLTVFDKAVYDVSSRAPRRRDTDKEPRSMPVQFEIPYGIVHGKAA